MTPVHWNPISGGPDIDIKVQTDIRLLRYWTNQISDYIQISDYSDIGLPYSDIWLWLYSDIGLVRYQTILRHLTTQISDYTQISDTVLGGGYRTTDPIQYWHSHDSNIHSVQPDIFSLWPVQPMYENDVMTLKLYVKKVFMVVLPTCGLSTRLLVQHGWTTLRIVQCITLPL